MTQYNGEWTGRFIGMRHGGNFEFATSSHYPGDPNFSGSFCDWISVKRSLVDKCRKAFDESLTVVITIEDQVVVSIKQVVEL